MHFVSLSSMNLMSTQWTLGVRGLWNGSQMIEGIGEALHLDKISEKMPYLQAAWKVAACFVAVICLIAVYRKSCMNKLTEESLSPVLGSPKVVPKRAISSIKVNEGVKEMPLMGFGTFIGIEHQAIDDLEERRKIVEQSILHALEAGCRHLDCASNYKNLEWVGNALKKAFQPKSEGGLGLKREEIWITSKDTTPNKENLTETLEALDLEYLDLYLVHYPPADLEKTWEEMNGLVDLGLVKQIGVSNFYRGQMEKLLEICHTNDLPLPYANEMEISPWVQEEEFRQYCDENGIRLIAYSPLGYGNAAALLETAPIVEKATHLHATAAQVALAWNMARGIAVIPSSRNKEHIKANCKAVEYVKVLQKDPTFMQSMREADLDLCSTTTGEGYKNKSKELSLK